DRVVDFDRRHRGANVTAAASQDLFLKREISAQTGDRRPVGDSELFTVVIGDARDADSALATIEEERSNPYCLDAGMRALGVGLAAGPTPAGERIVWVVVATRQR
ncbi:MAG: hypothetical protein NDJ75_04690, partial [Thermoanaerobaculia bacterium]|nr:hypothetical protein [Thermoanaerobaculia bacterium]